MLTVKQAKTLGNKLNELKELKGYKTIKEFYSQNSMDLHIDKEFKTINIYFTLNGFIYYIDHSRSNKDFNFIKRFNNRTSKIKERDISFNTFYRNFCLKVDQIRKDLEA